MFKLQPVRAMARDGRWGFGFGIWYERGWLAAEDLLTAGILEPPEYVVS